MKRFLWAGLAAGVTAGVLARRWWMRRMGKGPWGSLGGTFPEGMEMVPMALLQSTGTTLVEGNKLEWRDNGEVFQAMEEAVAAAEHSIHIDVFIWKPGGPGHRLADLVCEKARAGVKVRILVDPMGSPRFETELCPKLRAAGCDVRYFRPLKKRPLTLTGRNHRKLMVVDGRVAFTGGFGIAPEWSGDGLSPDSWRDANVQAEGPVVRQMQTAFAAHWLETGGDLLPASEFERAKPAGKARAAYVTSMDVKGLSSARWVTHIALAAARRRAWIANAYFVPPPQILGALCSRSEKGVDVRLLLPGPYQDHPMVTLVQRLLYPRLRRIGVRVYEYQPSMMHAKTMLVDDRLVVVGSINLDFLSLEFLEEGALVVDDRDFARGLEERWHRDVAHSRQVTLGRLPRPVPLPLPLSPGRSPSPPSSLPEGATLH